MDTPGDNQKQMDTDGDAMDTHLDTPPAKTTTNEGQTTERVIPSLTAQPQGSRPPPHPQTGVNLQNQTSKHTSSGTQGSEGSDITSIFDHRFPVERVVGREFSKKEDIARTIASLEKSLLEVKTKLTAVENKKKAAEIRCSELDTKYSDAVAEQVKLKKDFDDAVIEKDKLAQDLSDAIEQKKVRAESLDTLLKEVVVLHAKGFHKAIDQVKFLNPTVNVEGVGVFKKIVDGELVEESEDEE
ncbi:hypothetical protein SESBI_26507 [Sesbania bispinosa]|nr:hypothetical protein SESBI_26507 [Sesbania bispinosa]